MSKRRSFNLAPVQAPLSKEMSVYMTQADYERIKALAEERGEKGPGTMLRRLALAALEELER